MTKPHCPIHTKALLTVNEAAAYLSIGRNKVYQLIGRREIPTIRIDRSVRIRRQWLDEWLASSTEPPRGHG